MTFGGHLTNNERLQLLQAVRDGGLLGVVPRPLLLAGIPGGFVAGLQVVGAPLDQFQLDVVEINRVERMAEGIVPIRILLQNISDQLKQRDRAAEAAVVDALLNRVANTSTGVPPLPDPAALPEIVRNEQIVGTDDLLDLVFLSGALALSSTVARIAVPRFQDGQQVLAAGGPWVGHGTAWLIAPGLAITNHHVINARLTGEAPAAPADLRQQAEAAALEFRFERPDDTGPVTQVGALVAASPGLDYALLELVDPPAVPIPRLAPDRITVNATTRMAVNIVQHARGNHKQIAFRNNLVAGADGDTIRYYTDTDYGSSGSPVCDDGWRVVALHRGAKHAPGANYQGKAEAYVNFGSQVRAMLDHVRATDQALADRIVEGQA